MKRLPVIFMIIFISAWTSFSHSMTDQETLRSTPLKIGNDCEPKSLTTKIYLKTLNDQELKRFWLGQRYAVERSRQEDLEMQRINRINRAADDQIARIEEQRDAAVMSAMGVKPIPISPELKRSMAEVDSTIAEMDRFIAKSSYEWFARCWKYTDQRSK